MPFPRETQRRKNTAKKKATLRIKSLATSLLFTHRLRTLLLKLHFRSPNGRRNNDPAHFHSDNGWRRIGTCLFPLPDESRPTEAETCQGIEFVEALGHHEVGRFPLGWEAATGTNLSPDGVHTFQQQLFHQPQWLLSGSKLQLFWQPGGVHKASLNS